jgi:septal ring factor EnvC (AmiA/AmiB activator)
MNGIKQNRFLFSEQETNEELERLREDTRAAFSDAKQDIIKMRIRNLTTSLVASMEDLIEIMILDEANRDQEALETFRKLRASWKDVIDNTSPDTEEGRREADKKKTRFEELDRELTEMDSIMKSIENATRNFESHTSESLREIRRLLMQLHDRKTAEDLRDWVIETISIGRRQVP